MRLGAHINVHPPRPSTRMEKPPTMHIPQQRRDYSKAAFGAENPLAAKPREPSFGDTGLLPGEQS
jgi:hypothetical protein